MSEEEVRRIATRQETTKRGKGGHFEEGREEENIGHMEEEGKEEGRRLYKGKAS